MAKALRMGKDFFRISSKLFLFINWNTGNAVVTPNLAYWSGDFSKRLYIQVWNISFGIGYTKPWGKK